MNKQMLETAKADLTAAEHRERAIKQEFEQLKGQLNTATQRLSDSNSKEDAVSRLLSTLAGQNKQIVQKLSDFIRQRGFKEGALRAADNQYNESKRKVYILAF